MLNTHNVCLEIDKEKDDLSYLFVGDKNQNDLGFIIWPLYYLPDDVWINLPKISMDVEKNYFRQQFNPLADYKWMYRWLNGDWDTINRFTILNQLEEVHYIGLKGDFKDPDYFLRLNPHKLALGIKEWMFIKN